MKEVLKESKRVEQETLIDDLRTNLKNSQQSTKNGEYMNNIYESLVGKMFDEIERAFNELKQSQDDDLIGTMTVGRLFTHHISFTLDDVGTYEIYSVPNDGSKIIKVSSPLHPDCLVAF